jgi:hypothetical protein
MSEERSGRDPPGVTAIVLEEDSQRPGDGEDDLAVRDIEEKGLIPKKSYFCFFDNKPPTVIPNEATSPRKIPISLMVLAPLRMVTLPRDGLRLGKIMMFLRINTKIKRPSTTTRMLINAGSFLERNIDKKAKLMAMIAAKRKMGPMMGNDSKAVI